MAHPVYLISVSEDVFNIFMYVLGEAFFSLGTTQVFDHIVFTPNERAFFNVLTACKNIFPI